jgi:hypothetical protein
MRTIALALVLATPVFAASPDEALTVAKKMKDALEPRRPSVRTLAIRVSAQAGGPSERIAGQATTQDGGSHMVITVLSPESERGVALLFDERPDGRVVQHTYAPAVRRVRTIVPGGVYEPFVGSDFTCADVGFVDLNASFRQLPSQHRDKRELYALEEIPPAHYYYARIVSLVDPATWLPVRREFYDPGNHLWKVETFDDVHAIDGVPTPLHVRMEDLQARSNTELKVSGVRFDVRLPDSLFQQAELKDVASNPVWVDTATAGTR